MKTRYVAMLALAALAAGCSKEPDNNAEPAKPASTTIHEFMTERIDPDADAIWAIGNAALNDEATIDPARMSDQDWVDLKAAADRMADHSGLLEKLDPVVVVKPDAKISDEGVAGAPTREMIQAHLNKDTDVFRALADSLTTHATDLSSAAARKDALTAGRLINEMDGVCESCHLEFWYPEQRELMKKMGILPE